MKVCVVCYEGYKAEETPRAFLLGERRVEVMRVLDRSRDEWGIQRMESRPPMAGS